MPIREFECERCRKTFETLIRHVEEEKELECPACHGRHVRRLLSAPAALGSSIETASGGCRGKSGFT
ncbi:MAG: FmdB family zinc ribbon protein [Myxococcales bacterium]